VVVIIALLFIAAVYAVKGLSAAGSTALTSKKAIIHQVTLSPHKQQQTAEILEGNKND